MQRNYLEHLMRDCGRIEVRHQCGDRWVSGVFDNLHYLYSCIAGQADVGNLYTTLNAPRLMQATNDMDGRPLRDVDIGHYTRLLFDFDPVRGSGQASSDYELRLAIEQRNHFVQVLRGLGWPMPAMAMSGNGAHAMVRCRMPVSALDSG